MELLQAAQALLVLAGTGTILVLSIQHLMARPDRRELAALEAHYEVAYQRAQAQMFGNNPQ